MHWLSSGSKLEVGLPEKKEESSKAFTKMTRRSRKPRVTRVTDIPARPPRKTGRFKLYGNTRCF